MQPNNPLLGVTLARMLDELRARLGWLGLVRAVAFHCVESAPSLRSALNFLRKTLRAREKCEALYLPVLLGGAEKVD